MNGVCRRGVVTLRERSDRGDQNPVGLHIYSTYDRLVRECRSGLNDQLSFGPLPFALLRVRVTARLDLHSEGRHNVAHSVKRARHQHRPCALLYLLDRVCEIWQ